MKLIEIAIHGGAAVWINPASVVSVQTLPSSKGAERSKLTLSNGTSFEVDGLAPVVAERLASHDPR